MLNLEWNKNKKFSDVDLFNVDFEDDEDDGNSNNKKMEGKYDNDKYYEEDYTGEEYDNKEENINNNEFFGGNYEIENNDKTDSERDSTVTSKENSDGDGDGDDGDNNVKNMYGGNIDTNYGNEKFVQNIEKYNIEVIKIDN